jgi:tetratricopeptide (TPR) repeat protein
VKHEDFPDVEEKIEELINFSFIESTYEKYQSDEYLSVPVAAMIFGQKKRSVYPLITTIADDVEFLRLFGVSKSNDVKQGTMPQLQKFFKEIARKSDGRMEELDKYLPVGEYLGQRVNSVYLLLESTLRGISGERSKVLREKYLRLYLENEAISENKITPWRELMYLYEVDQKPIHCINIALSIASESAATLKIISEVTNTVNRILSTQGEALHSEERREVVRQLAEIFNRYIDNPEIDASDLSRIAWLHMHLGDSEEALSLVNRGLQKDPNNKYCNSLYCRIVG